MKKVTKATIAAAAAGVLLVGGAGTVALWSDSMDVDPGAVSTGHLTLDASAAGTWTDETEGAAITTFRPGTDHLVPGDTIVYTQNVIIGADGKNLKGELTATGLTGGTAVLPADVSVDVAVADSAVGLSQDGEIITFGEADTYTVPVTVTVAFAPSAVGSMDELVDLGSMTLTLNQVAPVQP
ncbi:alternate-type signal peptide domain-containing protein [Paeniglutamicibacter sp. Y32M11]|uniref:alternate-type signal peptide domain-containing protein n=1 Tax=Paeniglutamicibacter sp. Y32M11 TaxID=2853258 RepID=UPI001C5336A5|nr:alternate-type signal peptide domain-containing protein [Paeniglutamicibacter sp. Y32M11]QXQ09936.1 alternate-type signal peptide domain-containing protein [Paeniglutamicibacter sp. Y32M11]